LNIVSFVPVVVPPPTPSPQAEELGQRLAQVIHDYRQQHPEMSGLELRQALRIALLRAGGGNETPAVFVALAVALAGVAGLLVLLVTRPQGGSQSWVALLVGVLVVGIGLVFLLRGRQS
jgi:hypothetical protein